MDEREVEIRIKKLKKKVMLLIEQKNMVSIMNNTKWNELQKSVCELPFLPPYQLRCVTDVDELKTFDKDVCCTGNWDDELMLPFFNIEWIKVRPRYIKERGQLINGEIVDKTAAFIEILEKYSIPYEEENGAFIIYGYKKA